MPISSVNVFFEHSLLPISPTGSDPASNPRWTPRILDLVLRWALVFFGVSMGLVAPEGDPVSVKSVPSAP